ncbi:MAG: cyclase family protein [Candidatus Gracilibacteria bacterium]
MASSKKPGKEPKIYDISLPLYQGMVVYPNNTEFRARPIHSRTSVSSEIVMGSHAGTHVDAPKHVFPKGKGVDTIPVSTLVGACRVLDMTGCKKTVTVQDLQSARIKKGERILLKTRNSTRGFKNFYTDYIYLDGDAAEFLAKKGVALFGIDYLSVKQKGSEDNRLHTALLKKTSRFGRTWIFPKSNPENIFSSAFRSNSNIPDGAPAQAILMQQEASFRIISLYFLGKICDKRQIFGHGK